MQMPGEADVIMTLVVSVGLAVAAYRRGLLDLRGTLAGSVIGAIIGLSAGWEYVLLLLLYLLTSFAVTRWGYAAKKAAGVAEGSKGERGWRSVVANGAVPTGVAVLALLEVPGLEDWMVGVLFVTAIAAAASDTAASELGVLARDPVLITRPRTRVDPGTNGGISVRGQLFALAAAGYTVLLGAFLFVLSGWALGGDADIRWWVDNWWVIPLPVAIGFLSCQLDSVLGATLENAGHMTKNTVNFASIATSTLVTYLLLLHFVA